jgi:hypothetical protein
MTDTKTPTPQATRSAQFGRWGALLGGVINPIAFVAAYTVVGVLRPSYSPIEAWSGWGQRRGGRPG